MAQRAVAQAVDADSGKVLYTMEVTEGKGSEVVKQAGRFGYAVVDFYVTFHEPDIHTITFFLRKKKTR